MKKKLIMLVTALAVVFLLNPPEQAHAFCGGISHNLGECLDTCGCEYDFCAGTRPASQGTYECFTNWQSCQNDCQGWYG